MTKDYVVTNKAHKLESVLLLSKRVGFVFLLSSNLKLRFASDGKNINRLSDTTLNRILQEKPDIYEKKRILKLNRSAKVVR
jgi:hypothetical protein